MSGLTEAQLSRPAEERRNSSGVDKFNPDERSHTIHGYLSNGVSDVV